jgi:CRISPR-associated endonuclease Csn1
MGTPTLPLDPNAKLELAFDVGHSSIGWAVLQSSPSSISQTPSPALLGCGVVTFGADDCLASKRRDYRRQRRHARSTRQRIARMEKLLAHLGVLSAEQLAAKHQQAGGHSAPWLLAARVLASNGAKEHLLDWPMLWDVLRWYAHNRGYDGNRRWSEADSAEATEDTEKEQHAIALMTENKTETMAETLCGALGLNPLGDLQASRKNFKRLNAAFPRRVVESEVRVLLELHIGQLPKLDAAFIKAVMEDWKAIPVVAAVYDRRSPADAERRSQSAATDVKLPKRFQGGLLFGQLVPRFDNRIIAQCPFTFAEEFDLQIQAGKSTEEAKRNAEISAKVPGRNCLEFFNFRWAMTLANIRVGFDGETYDKGEALRSLNPEERRKVDAAVRKLGFLKVEKDRPGTDGNVQAGRNELREVLVREVKCHRHNLETLLLHPDAKDGLVLLPVEGDTTAFRVGWSCFDDPVHSPDGFYHDSPLRTRFSIQLLRQKKLSLSELIRQLEKIENGAMAQRVREAARKEASDKRGNLNTEKLTKIMAAEFFCPKLKGRARFSRVKLRQAFQEVFRKEKPLHPLETGGCLEQTDKIKLAAIQKDLPELTNNHLVRHRLLLLAGDARAKPNPREGLVHHLVNEFGGGDKRRVARITVELARDLQEMSGMTNKAKAKEMSAKLAHHQEVSEELAEKLRDANGSPLRGPDGRPLFASPGIIRKARILDDLGKQCPYTGHDIEYVHLAYAHPKFGTADKDHIIPRSQRLSDALEAQVITFSEVNRLKGQKTALQFIREMNLPENKQHKERFGIRTESQFRAVVDSLWPKSNPFLRARMGGEKVKDDEARCWRRKELMLKPSWDGKEFTPADLTKTRHIVKLAAQQLEAAFADLAREERPPVIPVTGAVTAAFRDKCWKLLYELAAVNPAVKEILAKGEREWEAGRDFNPKKAIREVTHLHHAVDSIALALVTSMLVPPKHQSLDGDLARFIVKGKLTVDKERGIDELSAFRTLCAKLRLPSFARLDSKNRLHIEELADSLKAQIRARLAEKRVVQHIPADMSGMKVEENTRGIVKVENGRATLRQQKRNADGKLEVKETEEVVGKLVGLAPEKGQGKLTPMKGVRVITDNFGVAILDHATNPDDKFVIIPWHKVWHRIDELKAKNGGEPARILRNGMLIQITGLKGKMASKAGTWRVFSVKQTRRLDLGNSDRVVMEDKGVGVWREVSLDTLGPERIQILDCGLCGLAEKSNPPRTVPAAEGR